MRAAGGGLLRGGAYKPRTSPYSFQGLGGRGLELLQRVKQETGLGIVTEVLDPRLVEVVAGVADMLQVGSRSMGNSALLREIGKSGKPVLLKRGMAGAVAHLKTATHLPVVVDPSHAAGRADLVLPLAKAGIAAGADGLLVEVHPAPYETHSDGAQAISPGALMTATSKPTARAAASWPRSSSRL